MPQSTRLIALAAIVLLTALHPSAGSLQTRGATGQNAVLHNVEIQKVAGRITTARGKNGRPLCVRMSETVPTPEINDEGETG